MLPARSFVAIPGMGHDLTPQLTEILLPQMVPFLAAEKVPYREPLDEP